MGSFLIAIDGPAGSGKSTIAKLLSEKLGFNHLDTGAMYRAVSVYLHSKGFKPGDDLRDVLESIEIEYIDGQIYLNGKKVQEEDIRSAKAGQLASSFATLPEVRNKLTQLQRKICEKGNFVVEGRDIGTVVLPHAQVKIFLTASFEERVRRRLKELKQKGIELSFEEVAKQIEERDQRDSSRDLAPLRPAEDAVIIDTTCKSIAQVLEEALEVVNRRKTDEAVRC
ncbi:(d)CMP kinase [Pseudothermotoga sp.]|uniref:(d)CMP kinase n=1 Tax=Pseudothermotoga sp. TaxID=2033661 RepID=UPI0031F72126